jgi:ABC transport system ATP-binding/permease protein
MTSLLLSLSGTGLTFGGQPLLSGADLDVEANARIALVGRNGSGKSTLLKIAAGVVQADHGERFVHPSATIRYLQQEPDFSEFESAENYITAGLDQGTDAYEVDILTDALHIPKDLRLQDCSGGEARRVAIAAALISKPNILLLDEPTNHLDLPAIAWLENHLKSLSSAVVVISHDRRFLENLTTKTVWLDCGQTRSLNRGFAYFEAWRDKALEEEAAAQHKLGRKIAAEEHWMRYGVTARRKRNMRRVGELKELRKNLREARNPQERVRFSSADVETSGKRVIVADTISKSYGEKNIVVDFSIEIARGDRIGFVGPNGAGKTTLLNMLIGALKPDAGSIKLGSNLNIVSLDQRRDSLKPDMRLADAIADERGDWVTIGDSKKHVASYLQDFLFAPEQWRAPVRSLSGGERGRLALAAALAKPSNLLVLDEPTNDLDLETLDLLEEMLASYEGTLLLVSHDRSFIDRIATSIITTAPEQSGKWRRYAGGYDDMIAQRGGAPGLTQKPPATAKPRTENNRPASRPAPNAKLSYKEKYALEMLPGEIDAMQEQTKRLKAKLADPSLFERDPALFHETAKSLEIIEQKLTSAEEDWLRLEIKREAFDIKN